MVPTPCTGDLDRRALLTGAAALGAEVLALRLRRLALSKAPALADPTDRGPHEALR